MPHKKCCCDKCTGECGFCCSTATEEYQVNVPSGTFVANTGVYPEPCPDCPDFDGTYIVTKVADIDEYLNGFNKWNSDASCKWRSETWEQCGECNCTYSDIFDEDCEPIICSDKEYYWQLEMIDSYGPGLIPKVQMTLLLVGSSPLGFFLFGANTQVYNGKCDDFEPIEFVIAPSWPEDFWATRFCKLAAEYPAPTGITVEPVTP